MLKALKILFFKKSSKIFCMNASIMLPLIIFISNKVVNPPLAWKCPQGRATASKCRFSKLETLLMAHNWHRVSSMGTNVKINIFGTHPVSCNECKCRKKKLSLIFFLSTTSSSNNIIYFYSKSKLLEVVHFLPETRTIFITMHSFAFSNISRIQVSVTLSSQIRLLLNFERNIIPFIFAQYP